MQQVVTSVPTSLRPQQFAPECSQQGEGWKLRAWKEDKGGWKKMRAGTPARIS